MAQGSLFTGSYAINGTTFTTEPSSGKWMPRKILGFDGAGHPIYPATREYELDFDFIDMQSANQLINFYNTVSNTGTVTIDLPQFNRSDWSFVSYSGCTLGELEMSEYFMSYPSKAKLLVYKIITG